MDENESQSRNRRAAAARLRAVSRSMDAWYGRERGSLEAVRMMPQARHISNLMPNAIKALSPPQASSPAAAAISNLRRQWTAIVGDRMAAVSSPSRIDGLTVVVETTHPAHSSILMPFKKKILAAAVAAGASVDSLSFEIAGRGPEGPSGDNGGSTRRK